MWSWRDRGRSVWDEAFGSLEAANFGSQGSSPKSLTWRLQNGELDGYDAKLVVLKLYVPRDGAVDGANRAEVIDGNGAVITQIRARQPQAKILLHAPFPRGQVSRDSWRRIAQANAAAIAELVDDETVFYLDIGERFFLPDGSHNQEMWRYPAVSGLENVGIQTPAFAVWAAELEPWIDRFVR
jgi:beta-glucosidase